MAKDQARPSSLFTQFPRGNAHRNHRDSLHVFWVCVPAAVRGRCFALGGGASAAFPGICATARHLVTHTTTHHYFPHLFRPCVPSFSLRFPPIFPSRRPARRSSRRSSSGSATGTRRWQNRRGKRGKTVYEPRIYRCQTGVEMRWGTSGDECGFLLRYRRRNRA